MINCLGSQHYQTDTLFPENSVAQNYGENSEKDFLCENILMNIMPVIYNIL